MLKYHAIFFAFLVFFGFSQAASALTVRYDFVARYVDYNYIEFCGGSYSYVCPASASSDTGLSNSIKRQPWFVSFIEVDIALPAPLETYVGYQRLMSVRAEKVRCGPRLPCNWSGGGSFSGLMAKLDIDDGSIVLSGSGEDGGTRFEYTRRRSNVRQGMESEGRFESVEGYLRYYESHALGLTRIRVSGLEGAPAYAARVNAIPLPAGLPLLMGALGLLWWRTPSKNRVIQRTACETG